ncbi:tetratricopeptide repeat protein [Zunongwangia sp.]|uniref:tetratricopeptide repeat-containing sensor histidine kinase n=1 Tax=Zunongwangia sp. TaxID=1965325 RepID=UPI003AA7EB3A
MQKKDSNFALMKRVVFIFNIFLIICSCNLENGIESDIGDSKMEEAIIKASSTYNRKSKISDWKGLSNDSLKLKIASNLSRHYSKVKDSLNFNYWNYQFLNISRNKNDRKSIASAYWDRASYNYRLSKLDSSYFYYFKASKIYEETNNTKEAASTLFSAGVIQRDLKDYLGSEVTTIKSLKIYQQLNNQFGIYSCYNNLGIIHNNLKNFDRSLKYHMKAIEMANKLNKELLVASSKNNISVVLREKGAYKKSILKIEEALEIDSIFTKNPQLYARLLDNLAYSKLQMGEKNDDILDAILKSKEIKSSIQDDAGLSISYLHLAEYYIAIGHKKKAFNILNRELEFAKRTMNDNDVLTTLDFLAELDKENAFEYLHERINITDSLLDIEHKTQDKFARIQYETDKVVSENEKLTTDKKLILGSGTVIIALIILLSFAIYQKNNIKKLQLEKAQVKANEEIYQLLISQHQNIEEARQVEKNRISKELHDGVLGKLFGIRFLLSSVNEKNDEVAINNREKYLKELEKTEQEIRQISHNLRDNADINKKSFYGILENFILEQRRISNFNIDFRLDLALNILDKVSVLYKINIFRILQESVSNIRKYAEATNAKVYLDFVENDSLLILIIEDNGRGFDTKKNSSGIGIKNMRERTLAMKGDFNIVSNPGKTKISVKIPIQL